MTPSNVGIAPSVLPQATLTFGGERRFSSTLLSRWSVSSSGCTDLDCSTPSNSSSKLIRPGSKPRYCRAPGTSRWYHQGIVRSTWISFGLNCASTTSPCCPPTSAVIRSLATIGHHRTVGALEVRGRRLRHIHHRQKQPEPGASPEHPPRRACLRSETSSAKK